MIQTTSNLQHHLKDNLRNCKEKREKEENKLLKPKLSLSDISNIHKKLKDKLEQDKKNREFNYSFDGDFAPDIYSGVVPKMDITPVMQEVERKSIDVFFPVFTPNNYGKDINKQIALGKAYKYLGLIRCRRTFLELFMSLKNQYSEVIATRTFFAESIGCCDDTITNVSRYFHNLGIIRKTSRGWAMINPAKKIFKSHANRYETGHELERDMKFIAKTLGKTCKIINRLIAFIPTLAIFFVLTSFDKPKVNNNYNNILKKDSLSVDFEKSRQEREEIREWFKKKPTIPVSIQEVNMICGETNPGNLIMEEITHYKGKEKTLNGMYLDLTSVRDSLYPLLDDARKAVVSLYCTEKKIHGTVDNVNKSLQSRGLSSKIWTPTRDTSKLAKEEIVFIKCFPENIKEMVRQKLAKHPDRRNDFQWILEHLIGFSQMNNVHIKSLLSRYGFNTSHIKDPVKRKFDYIPKKVSSGSYKKFDPSYYDDLYNVSKNPPLKSCNPIPVKTQGFLKGLDESTKDFFMKKVSGK